MIQAMVFIANTDVDNSVESTGYSTNSYVCNNTNDKVFLLSHQEATTYYGSNDERKTQGTDYAKAQGLYVESNVSEWWLRSPYRGYANYATGVNNVGGIYNGIIVYYTRSGVRPALWIDL